MHKAVNQSTIRERSRQRKSKSKGCKKPNFSIGDYVLCSPQVKKAGEKLHLNWRGPYQIVDARRNYVFEVRNIVNHEVTVVHGDRIKFYSDDQLNVTEELKAQFSYDNATFEIEKISDLGEDKATQELRVLVKWKGFSERENSWEPIKVIWEDAPITIKEFCRENPKHALMEKLLKEIPIAEKRQSMPIRKRK
jgi:hypothetical protein